MLETLFAWIKPKPRAKPNPSYVGHKLVLIRKIKDKKGYHNAEIYLDGQMVATSMHDLFGDGDRFVEDYDLLYEATDYPLMPELILNHSNYESLRIALVKTQIKSLTIEILDRYVLSI